MKTATRLQFSTLVTSMARTAAWAVVTMSIGLLLVILFGSPLTASAPTANDLPGSSHPKETGPWIYPPVIVGV